MGLRFARRSVVDALRAITLLALLTGCHAGYVIESAYYQADLLQSRVPVTEVLKDPSVPATTKSKLTLAQDARIFAEKDLGLHKTSNYTTFVQLNRPYVTYAVSAAPRSELKSYLWSFPIVGDVPYLGFFREDHALNEARDMKAKGYDAYVRGVTAFSTLGWFKDPILSSMMDYEDYDLVNTIIHETVHATLFIKNSAEFNEQLATFVGNAGAELFYHQHEGDQSETLARVKLANQDDRLFAEFITREINSLKAWYKNEAGHFSEDQRQARLHEIQQRYIHELKPRLATNRYDHFSQGDLNNARLLVYQTYYQDYADFERAFAKTGRDFHRFVDFCKSLEKETHPAETLKKFAGD